jgi:uncharacterized protein (DUF1330 family)
MDFANAMQPTGDQMRQFRDTSTGKDIYMLNLLKFRERAEYEDGRETELTGEQAYAIYGKRVAEIVRGLGGNVVFGGTPRNLLIGQVDDMWDQMALVRYPNMQTMGKMMQMQEYKDAHVHRHAGLQGQLLIECAAGGSVK